MNRVVNSFFFFICTFYLVSCNIDPKKTYSDRVMMALEQNVNFKKGVFTHIVVIPGAGCEGCISESESFFKKNTNKNIYFVFTKISSLKVLRLKFGEKLNSKNVYIDLEKLFLSDDERINSYPIVFYIHDVKNVSWSYLEPGISFDTKFD